MELSRRILLRRLEVNHQLQVLEIKEIHRQLPLTALRKWPRKLGMTQHKVISGNAIIQSLLTNHKEGMGVVRSKAIVITITILGRLLRDLSLRSQSRRCILVDKAHQAIVNTKDLQQKSIIVVIMGVANSSVIECNIACKESEMKTRARFKSWLISRSWFKTPKVLILIMVMAIRCLRTEAVINKIIIVIVQWLNQLSQTPSSPIRRIEQVKIVTITMTYEDSLTIWISDLPWKFVSQVDWSTRD